MTIVLNEHEWAENMIKSQSLGSKPYETLCRVAKYYIDKGFSKKETRKMLDRFLLQCEPTSSLPKWSETLDYAVTRATKYNAIKIDHITITEPELEIMDKLESTQLRRLAFTLLCLAKYWNLVNPNGDCWVNNKDNEIMRMANINTSIKRQSQLYHILNECGLIRFSKKIDNTNVRVCFIKEGREVLQISDFRNLGYQYLKYQGEPYFECENCGITLKIKNVNQVYPFIKFVGRPQKYCPDCAAEMHIQQTINSVMRNRTRNIRQESNNFEQKEYTVYLHKLPNKKSYVGMTSQSLNKRWRGGTGYKSNLEFNKDIQTYGWDNIEHYILYKGLDKKSAEAIESYCIKKYHTYLTQYGYNISKTSYSKIEGEVTPELLNIKVDGNGQVL